MDTVVTAPGAVVLEGAEMVESSPDVSPDLEAHALFIKLKEVLRFILIIYRDNFLAVVCSIDFKNWLISKTHCSSSKREFKCKRMK